MTDRGYATIEAIRREQKTCQELVAKAEQRVNELTSLANKCWPGLKPSGLCSKHHRDFSCSACYPNWRELVAEHLKVSDEMRAKVMAIAGVDDPKNGRVGFDSVLQAIKGKISGAESLREQLTASQAEVVRLTELLKRDPLTEIVEIEAALQPASEVKP